MAGASHDSPFIHLFATAAFQYLHFGETTLYAFIGNNSEFDAILRYFQIN